MPTPHISAPDGAFAETVLMPGDPLRAVRLATTFLDDAELVTEVRGMKGFTGTYQGAPVSVMPSGMGMPSAAIYITELIRFYGVQRLIRVGTAGAYQPTIALRQIVAADAAVTNSSMLSILGAPDKVEPSPALLAAAKQAASDNGVDLITGTILSSDVFYEPTDDVRERHTANGVVGVEMESAALYAIANIEGVDALTLVTMTDNLVTGENLSAEDRQLTVDEMLELGLRTAVVAA